jgi:uncharacterized membrane protein HdeD (DUF308 family)
MPDTTTISVPATDPLSPRTLHINHFFDGIIFALAIVAALLFIRFYRKSRDRLFLFFAAAFAIFGLNRILFQFYGDAPDESKTWLYAIRLLSFLLIIIAILDKNLRQPARRP